MKAELSLSEEHNEVTMNFTYSFIDDPINESVFGNITWKIPYDNESPAHWVHAEFPCNNYNYNYYSPTFLSNKPRILFPFFSFF